MPSALVILAGCSLLTDLNGLSGGGAGGGPPADGGSSTGDALSVSAEGSAGDAGDASSGDALVEASGCARYPTATFCADFDGTNPLAVPPWTENEAIEPTPPGTIALTASDPISPSSAARIELAKSMTPCRYLRLVKKLPGTFGNVRAHVAMRAEDPEVLFALSVTVSPTLGFTLLIALNGGTLVHFFAQQNLNGNMTQIGDDNVDLDQPWPGRWLDVTVEYTSVPTKSASVTVAGGRKLVIPLPATFVATDPATSIGPFCANAVTRATYDDFALWVTP